MKISIISFTDNGHRINKKLNKILPDCSGFGKADGLQSIENGLSHWTRKAFESSDGIIFVGATGIAVRAIAPYIKSKDIDPAILVIDDRAQHVIPLLSGHMGGANEFAIKVAEILEATPIITTATDINHVFAVDTWAVKNDMTVCNIENIKHISSALLKGDEIGIVSDFPIVGNIPRGIKNTGLVENGICISLDTSKQSFKNTLNLVPKCLHIGVGSRKNADGNAVVELFKKLNIPANAVKTVSTINIKSEESSILELCNHLNLPLITYTAGQLNEAKGEFTTSEFVRSITGTDNVCERSAMLSSDGNILIKKTSGNGVTISVAMEEWSAKF